MADLRTLLTRERRDLTRKLGRVQNEMKVVMDRANRDMRRHRRDGHDFLADAAHDQARRKMQELERDETRIEDQISDLDARLLGLDARR